MSAIPKAVTVTDFAALAAAATAVAHPSRVARAVTAPAPDLTETPLVVIVDDDAGICWAFENYFRDRGWEVQTAASGEQGLELLDDLRLLGRSVRLVLIDISLPGIDGIRAIELYRKLTRLKARVIAMSAYHGPEVVKGLGQQGVDLFLEKPIDLANFDRLLASFPR